MSDDNVQHLGRGISVHGFATAQEFQEFLQNAETEVQSRTITAQQMGVSYGDHFVRFVEDLIIFGRVTTLDEEDVDMRDVIANNNTQRNNLWTDCYSEVVPTGEYGYTHRSVLWPISAHAFASARTCEWDITKMIDWAVLEVETAYHSLRALYAPRP